jgi:hypothetical protein
MRSIRALVLIACVAVMGIGVLGVSNASAAVCQGVADCDDGNACTQNRCINGTCVFPERPAGTACTSDGDPCTRDLCLPATSVLTCQHPPVAAGSSCPDDGNPCTRDQCLPSSGGGVACAHQPVSFGSPCPDDGNVCTLDRCGPDQSGNPVCGHTSFNFGTPCTTDDNPCTTDICVPDPLGVGTCAHQPLSPGSLCDDDGKDCTFDTCAIENNVAFCRHAPLSQGSACDDHSICTQYDACDNFGSCVGTAPILDCRVAAKSSLSIKNNERNSTDVVDFKWQRGAATEVFELGDPTTTTGYTFCVFDGNGLLRLSAAVPAGESCGDDPCWKAHARGFAYADKLRLTNGIGKLRLTAGAAEKSSVQVSGKGIFLPLPALPLTGTIRAQVVNDETGVCFESQFTTPKFSTDRKYLAQKP